jgi:hypothetical protein
MYIKLIVHMTSEVFAIIGYNRTGDNQKYIWSGIFLTKHKRYQDYSDNQKYNARQKTGFPFFPFLTHRSGDFLYKIKRNSWIFYYLIFLL